MIAPSSSSLSDQLALVGDRIKCLRGLNQTLQSSNGVPIVDTMSFFAETNQPSNSRGVGRSGARISAEGVVVRTA